MSAYYNDNFNFTQQSTTNWSERILHDIIGFLHILSPAGKVLYCSESCLELTGYSSHELIGKSLTDFIHVDDLDIFARNFQLAFSSLIRIKVHYRIRRKDNTYLLLESIGHPKQDILDRPPQSFFAIAQPYLSRSNGLLDSFLELKMENEWLKKRLSDLLPYQPQQQQQQQQQQQIRQPQPQPQQQLQQNHQHQQQLQQPQQQQPQQQQQLQHQQQNQQFKSYSQSFLSNNNDNNILLATNEHYFMNHTSVDDYVCADCGTTASPEWRKGPHGPKTLCNACGLRWAKKNKKI
ncbi:PAS domain-containing protein [Pilaira anomala]|nr:PAS domain-containing protein [Pilaira anomala]